MTSAEGTAWYAYGWESQPLVMLKKNGTIDGTSQNKRFFFGRVYVYLYICVYTNRLISTCMLACWVKFWVRILEIQPQNTYCNQQDSNSRVFFSVAQIRLKRTMGDFFRFLL